MKIFEFRGTPMTMITERGTIGVVRVSPVCETQLFLETSETTIAINYKTTDVLMADYFGLVEWLESIKEQDSALKALTELHQIDIESGK